MLGGGPSGTSAISTSIGSGAGSSRSGRGSVGSGRGVGIVGRARHHRLKLHRALGDVGVDELVAHHRERPEPAGHPVVEPVESRRAVIGSKAPSWVLATGDSELAPSRIMSMPKPASYSPTSRSARCDEQAGDVVGVAGRPAGIDRQRHHLVVDAIEEEVEGLRARAPRLRAGGRAGWRGRCARHQHVVDEADRIGEASFGVVLGDRKARDDPFLDTPSAWSSRVSRDSAEAGLQALRSRS